MSIRTYSPDAQGYFASITTKNGSCRLRYVRGSFHADFGNGYSCSLPEFSRASQALDYALRLLA